MIVANKQDNVCESSNKQLVEQNHINIRICATTYLKEG